METIEKFSNSGNKPSLTSPSLSKTMTGLLVVPRICVYIDGANFYRNLKELGIVSINFRFREFLSSQFPDTQLVSIRYYIGQVKRVAGNQKSETLYRNQQIFLEKLLKQNINIIKGRIRQIGDVFTEKGVDVRMAIDLLEGAYENYYDEAVLVSSDGDLAPAVRMVVSKGKQITIMGFAHKLCFALIQTATKYLSLRKTALENFI